MSVQSLAPIAYKQDYAQATSNTLNLKTNWKYKIHSYIYI